MPMQYHRTHPGPCVAGEVFPSRQPGSTPRRSPTCGSGSQRPCAFHLFVRTAHAALQRYSWWSPVLRQDSVRRPSRWSVGSDPPCSGSSCRPALRRI